MEYVMYKGLNLVFKTAIYLQGAAIEKEDIRPLLLNVVRPSVHVGLIENSIEGTTTSERGGNRTIALD